MNEVVMKGNYAFIDGQNLQKSTTKNTPSREVDFYKLAIFLKDKYKVSKIFYFLWYRLPEYEKLYTKMEQSGFTLIFNLHTAGMISKKWGNVDCNIVFEIMKNLLEESDQFGKVVLISSDGDYKMMVDYLIQKERFLKMLLPSEADASSLYKKLWSEYYDFLTRKREKIQRE